ncbi:uncharacterized protein AruCF_2118 [Achromobacter ruhlandii]|nr:uncharacterized protein AruCF_2118 [Achromobacter ruhlandii]
MRHAHAIYHGSRIVGGKQGGRQLTALWPLLDVGETCLVRSIQINPLCRIIQDMQRTAG